MSGKRIKKKHSKLAQTTAKKSGVADEPSIRPLVNPQKEGGPALTLRMASGTCIRVARIRRRSPGRSRSPKSTV